MAATVSGISSWSQNRDSIITRALRVCGAIGQGETPATNAITEGAMALNDMVKRFQTDGMPLWKISQGTAITYTATNTYVIGKGQGINQTAPLKILQAFNRDNTVTPATDSPILIIPYQDYLYLGAKTSTGQPSQLFYKTPGQGATVPSTELVGTITVYPQPDTITQTNKTLIIIGHYPFEDFNAATDIPDFPSYWFDAIIFNLAANLAYEYGVGLAERAMIAKRADQFRDEALSFGTEEGSLFLRPTVQYNSPGGSQY